jgi:two-component system chemotaxis response regulator CheB
MPTRDIIVVGASAGGVQVLTELVRGLPKDLPAAVFVVIHTSPTSPSVLPQLLDRAGPLPAAHAEDGEAIAHSRIYVAQPDYHLLLSPLGIIIAHGPRENGFRPAVDPLFRTAARSFGSRVIGVVLSGGLDDGTEGLTLIKRFGGIAIAQDPDEAVFPSMPASAINNVDVDHVLKVSEMPAVLTQLARESVPESAAVMTQGDGNARDLAESGDHSLLTGDIPGPPSAFTCPECGGAIWELRDGKLVKYRCHVGHSYTPEGFIAAQSERLEGALWTALRALEENAAVRRRMADRAENWPGIARQFSLQAEESESRASVIREILLSDKVTDGNQSTRLVSARAGAAAERAARSKARNTSKAKSNGKKHSSRANGDGHGNKKARADGHAGKKARSNGHAGKKAQARDNALVPGRASKKAARR